MPLPRRHRFPRAGPESGYRLRIHDARDHRRGLVLGLTLAEVLVLLVFLLLLSAAALIIRKERQVDIARDDARRAASAEAAAKAEAQLATSALAQVNKAAEAAGVKIDDAVGLAAVLERAAEAAALRSQLQESRRQLDGAKAEASARAAENAAIAAALERVPGARGQNLRDKAALVAGQNEQMRKELDRVKGNGGSGLPYCWAQPDGSAQFMLKVELQDSGVIVHPLEPRARPEDPTWQLLDPIAESNSSRSAILSRRSDRLRRRRRRIAASMPFRFSTARREPTSPATSSPWAVYGRYSTCGRSVGDWLR